MKAIKRLTNEKAAVSKLFKEQRDMNLQAKSRLDKDMRRYQAMQGQCDKLPPGDPQLETLAAEMNALLTNIESGRALWIASRDSALSAKQRLSTLDEALTESRGELVAVAGLLDQNHRLREQIQQEERVKVQALMAAEISEARGRLEAERQAARGELQVK
jgi:hypothetical protein